MKEIQYQTDENGVEWIIFLSHHTGEPVAKINKKMVLENYKEYCNSHPDFQASIDRAIAAMENTPKEVEEMLKLLNQQGKP